MTMNRVQFQPGLSMPEFLERYGTEAKCQAALQAARWPDGFACPDCGAPGAYPLRPRRSALLAVPRLPAPVQPDQRHHLRLQQAAPVALVPGHAAPHPIQEQRLGARAHAPARRELPHRLARQAQDHGGDAPSRGAPGARWSCGDRRRLPGWRALGRQGRPRLGEQGAHRGSGSDHPRGPAPGWPACASNPTPRNKSPSSLPSTWPPRPASSPTGCGASVPPRSSAPNTSASSPAAARPA
jgi:hypothetical protein